MISTVTTSTITTITLGGSFALIGIFFLLTLLVQKEFLGTSKKEWAVILRKFLNVGIVPLLIAFMLYALSQVLSVLKIY